MKSALVPLKARGLPARRAKGELKEPFEKLKKLGLAKCAANGMADVWRLVLDGRHTSLETRVWFGAGCRLFRDLAREPMATIAVLDRAQVDGLAGCLLRPGQAVILSHLTVGADACRAPGAAFACLSAVTAPFTVAVQSAADCAEVLACVRAILAASTRITKLTVYGLTWTAGDCLADPRLRFSDEPARVRAILHNLRYMDPHEVRYLDPRRPVTGFILKMSRGFQPDQEVLAHVHALDTCVDFDCASPITSFMTPLMTPLAAALCRMPLLRTLRIILPRSAGDVPRALLNIFDPAHGVALAGGLILVLPTVIRSASGPRFEQLAPSAVPLDDALAASLATVVRVSALTVDMRAAVWPRSAFAAVSRLLHTGATDANLGCTATVDPLGADALLCFPPSVTHARIILPARTLARALRSACQTEQAVGVTSLRVWTCPVCGCGDTCVWDGHRADCSRFDDPDVCSALRDFLLRAPALTELTLQVCGPDTRLLLALTAVLAAAPPTLHTAKLTYKLPATPLADFGTTAAALFGRFRHDADVAQATQDEAARLLKDRPGFAVHVDGTSIARWPKWAALGADPVVLA